MELEIKRIKLGEELFLNLIKNDNFKSNLLSFYLTRSLNRDEVTKTALLSLILKSESKDYPSNLEIEKRLEELYGADLSSSISRRGEKQIIRISLEWARGEFVRNKELDYQAINLLKEIALNPSIKNEAFQEKTLTREKENLKKIIESKINDKRSYAIERCIEEMCKSEKFGIHPLGYIEDLNQIDGKILYDHYKKLMATSPIEIFYVGKYDSALENYLKEIDLGLREELIQLPQDLIIKSSQNKKVIRELLDVNQGKLVIGYRAAIDFKSRLYNPLLIANEILGGGPSSKLFKNIREKESLAYYIGSSLLKYKSIILIDGGIEFSDYDKTLSLIKKELDDLKNGNFTDYDISLAIKSLISSIESTKDSISMLSEFSFSQILSGDKRSLDEIINDLESTKKEDIIEAAKEIEIDTIYFMDKLR